ncbi:unnamed protein product [Danaus chrysippus]|uniref:(African queen) hypothetical protein n=1 Tax=Danaus chrysippus TaxID=151541 RepID=A0A8J2R2F7_9NEOP|nr:unnamed protein product [Danaus chrysippus]
MIQSPPTLSKALQNAASVDPSLLSGTRPRRPVRGRRRSTSFGRIGASYKTLGCTKARSSADSPNGRSRPPAMSRAGGVNPDADGGDLNTMYTTLSEYLLLENKFQPRLSLPEDSENGDVTTGARDGAAHVLRCLKVWFDLPAEVLVNAINLFDRFLSKMKVRPCHVPCITVSCMNIAIDEYADTVKQARNVTIEELVLVSQSACTAGDVSRMSLVIKNKLSLAGHRSITVLHWLKLFRKLVAAASDTVLPEDELINLLEIAVCDARCVNSRTSELALVLIFYKLEQHFVNWSRRAAEGGPPVPEQAYYLYEFAAQLQQHCHMSDESLVATHQLVRDVAARYEARMKAPHRQRLVWRLSERTLKVRERERDRLTYTQRHGVLRPTDRLTSLLPTIEEQHLTADATPKRNRTGSESEETSDWPCSPVLPVYCDN